MTGIIKSTTQSLTSQTDHEIITYMKVIPIQLKDPCHRLVEEEILSVSSALQTGPVYIAIPGNSVPSGGFSQQQTI